MEYDDLLGSNTMNTNCTPIQQEFEFENFVSHRTQVVAVAYGCICIVGLVANLTLFFSLFFGGITFKAPSTILIMNLAIADTLLLLTLPFAIAHRLQNHWPFGSFFCKLEEGLKFLSYYASVFFITAMAVDRYFIICRPASYDRKKAYKNLKFVSGFLWLLAMLVVVPLMTLAGVDQYGFCNIIFPGKEESHSGFEQDIYDDYPHWNTTINCYEDLADIFYPEYNDGDEINVVELQELFSADAKASAEEALISGCQHAPFQSLHTWLISNFIIGFVIPFCIISVCYLQIIKMKSVIISTGRKTLIELKTNKGISRPNESKRSVMRKKASPISNRAKMILDILIPCLILAFAVCWLPYHAWHLAQINGVNGISVSTCNLIRDFTFCLAFFNRALDPILNSLFLFNFKGKIQRSTTWLKKLTQSETNEHASAENQLKSRRDIGDSRSCEEVNFLTTGAEG